MMMIRWWKAQKRNWNLTLFPVVTWWCGLPLDWNTNRKERRVNDMHYKTATALHHVSCISSIHYYKFVVVFVFCLRFCVWHKTQVYSNSYILLWSFLFKNYNSTTLKKLSKELHTKHMESCRNSKHRARGRIF